mgnify:CR=1 FL=1
MKIKSLFLSLLFLASAFLSAQEVSFDETFALEDYNFVLGTQGIGGKYQFSNESKLIEQAKHIRGMGSNILKISLGPKSPKSYGFGKSKATSTLELFQSIPDYKQVFDMYFKYIFVNQTIINLISSIFWCF